MDNHVFDVSSLVPVPQYREQRQHIFPSDGSLDWFMRRNRDALRAAGAYLVIGGRRHVQPDRFDAVVREVGSRDAQA